MPESPVRIDRLEVWRDSIDNRLWGGGPIAYERSIEGRLHAMEDTTRSADALADAARELRRVRDRRLTGWERTLLVTVGLVTATASIVAAIAAVLALG